MSLVLFWIVFTQLLCSQIAPDPVIFTSQRQKLDDGYFELKMHR